MRTWLTASCTKHQKSSKQHGKVKWKSFLNIFVVLAVVRHQKIKLTYRVLLGFSSNVMYSVPWTSSFKVKSSTNISWCSWQPRRPKWRVSRYHRVQRNDFFRSFGELLYFVPRNFREPGRHFFLNKDAHLCCSHGYSFVLPSFFFFCYTSITQKYHHY